MNEMHTLSDGTDTAHHDWEIRWQSDAGREEWLRPDPLVMDFIDEMKARGVQRVLDLGCGVGRHAILLAEQGFDVIAIDGSPSGLKYLQQTAENLNVAVDCQLGLMTDLPLGNNSVDYVLAFNVIYHGSPAIVERSIAEIERVLTDQGLFQGTMLSKRNANFGIGTEVDKDTFIKQGESDKSHPHFYCNGRELLELFSGFEPLSISDKLHSKPGSWHWHLTLERNRV
jgi:SAM-dependent methyltransferase